MGFISRKQHWFKKKSMYTIHHIDRINTKAHMIFSTYRKYIWQNLFIHDKEKTQKTRNRWEFLLSEKSHIQKPTVTTYPIVTYWMYSPVPQYYCVCSPHSCSTSTGSHSQRNTARKEQKTYSLEIKKYKCPYWRYNSTCGKSQRIFFKNPV